MSFANPKRVPLLIRVQVMTPRVAALIASKRWVLKGKNSAGWLLEYYTLDWIVELIPALTRARLNKL